MSPQAHTLLNWAGKIMLGYLFGTLIAWGGFGAGAYIAGAAVIVFSLALIEQPWVRR
jgi:hypothetical protein